MRVVTTDGNCNLAATEFLLRLRDEEDVLEAALEHEDTLDVRALIGEDSDEEALHVDLRETGLLVEL